MRGVARQLKEVEAETASSSFSNDKIWHCLATMFVRSMRNGKGEDEEAKVEEQTCFVRSGPDSLQMFFFFLILKASCVFKH